MTSCWISYTVIYLDSQPYKVLTDLVSLYLQWGFPVGPPQAQDRGSRVEQRLGLFTQLWGSPGPGEREDVFRASLIMAASEEINRQGPAGMLQLLPLTGGRDRGEERWTAWRERRRCGGGRWKARRGVDVEGGEERRRWTRTPGDTP